MDSGPEAFAGAAFALFGGGLLLWAAVCVRTGQPVAVGYGRVAGTVTALLAGAGFLTVGCRLLGAL
ncbi:MULTISPECIES: hypothetical protein [Streptomyces]|uniref:Uncharacterized protein n=1 Tax=Streptomyces noursei TaxID=1971 RepID=A0A059W6P7_STRNR|nr:hypothetical protein [Streptomyces noursei]AKA05186.1 hypothetical protein SAZ_24130 [Streptomyces noursei ZPM]AIA04993.1 hypothetical protein DC74_4513 [Streptomyces noursei]EOT01978.1 hypothetical protein K530_21081 [Streptomyces noursei CCRC 11814]EXU89040.1 hypothetical protein P354_24670 [Streptomyces noursei PD-1]MCE4947188.1 hypothetical protein [Streptomyces noursei]